VNLSAGVGVNDMKTPLNNWVISKWHNTIHQV